MDQQGLIRVAGSTDFWRRCYGRAYLSKAELTAGDDIVPKAPSKIDYRAMAAAAMKTHECQKAIKALNVQPLYPGGWTMNKEGHWELFFYATP